MSPMSQPKITSQKPKPFDAADFSLSSETYFPRRTPSTSKPPILILVIPFACRSLTSSCGSTIPVFLSGLRLRQGFVYHGKGGEWLLPAPVGHGSHELAHILVDGASGHEHDLLRQPRMGARQLGEEVAAGQPGHHEIAENQVEAIAGADELQRGLTAGDHAHL